MMQVTATDFKTNFGKYLNLVDEKGTAVILKNNAPRYVLLDYNMLRQASLVADGRMDCERLLDLIL